jgi:polysaccharide export outer membrane protein
MIGVSLGMLVLALVQPPAAPLDEYRVGPNDILKVTVYGHEDLSQLIVVQPDGAFNFPLVGRVVAAPLTERELAQRIKDALAGGFVRDPQVTVVVHEFRSKRVFVVGQIARPGPYPLSGRSTLTEILARAGPLAPGASAEIIIVRPHGEVDGPTVPLALGELPAGAFPPSAGAEVLRVDVRQLEAGKSESNQVLRPNDTVFVPAAPRVFVSGEVRNPGAQPFASGMTVRQAIALAGGLTEDGSTKGIQVIRAGDPSRQKIKVKIDDPIQPGDTIVVKAKLF